MEIHGSEELTPEALQHTEIVGLECNDTLLNVLQVTNEGIQEIVLPDGRWDDPYDDPELVQVMLTGDLDLF